MTITNADIVSRLKLLADYHGKATSGTTTTLVCNDLVDEKDATGYFICFVSGTHAGTDHIVTDFTVATGTLTFSALSSAVTNTDEFCLVSKGYQSEVSQAALVVAEDFKNKGYDASLFLTDSQLKELHIAKVIELACYGLMNDAVDTDAYFANAQRANDRYRLIMANLIADYDANEDGSISTDEEKQSIGQVVFSR